MKEEAMSEPGDRLAEACPLCGRRPNQRLRERRGAFDDAWLDLSAEKQLAEAYYVSLQTHLRAHGCDHDFADVADRPEVVESQP